jgi:uracil-DNA glycosylase
VERVATKKSVPGTYQIKGDGKKNRYVINMFTQFYPGSPKYPNDNIIKRIEWLNACLEKLLEMGGVESIAFPKEIGGDHNDRYLNTIDDFKKKYYLKNHTSLQIVDYNNENLLVTTDKKEVKYDRPIISVQMTDLDDTIIPHKKINIIKHIDLKDLVFYEGLQSPIAPSPTPPSVLPSASVLTVASNQDTVVLGEKKKMIRKKVTVDKKDATVDKKDAIVDKKDATVDKKDATVDKKDATVDKKDATVDKKDATVDKKDATVDKKDVKKEGSGVVPHPPTPDIISELIHDLGSSWDPIFGDPSMIPIINQLNRDIWKEMAEFSDILPIPQSNIFNAFKECPFPPKCLIMGQDCYAEHVNQAMGLSFSVQDGVSIPPSLKNIFTELSTDITGFTIPSSGNLTKWAQQGALLLNAALTVRLGQKASHIKLWKSFTDTVIHLISEKSKTPIVYMLWGNFAKGKKILIVDQLKCLILEAAHPSPLSAKNGFFGCHHFSKCNDYLIEHKMSPIEW